MTDRRDKTGRWFVGDVPESLYISNGDHLFKYEYLGSKGREAVIAASHLADRAIWKMMDSVRNC